MRPAPWTPDSVILGIDEATLRTMGGQRAYRPILSETLERITTASPKVVVVDMILADPTEERDDARLEAALRATPNLVLDCEAVNGAWEDPLPRFHRAGAALGEVLVPWDKQDGVSRFIPLEHTAARERRWALSLEALKVFRGAKYVMEESTEQMIEVAGLHIPAPRHQHARDIDRPLWIRFRYEGLPVLSVAELRRKPELAETLRGKAVFIGVTAMSATRDRLVNPYGQDTPGVQIHAQAFETLNQGRFLVPAGDHLVIPLAIALAATAGAIFVFVSGWPAYILAALLLATAHLIPVLFFKQDIIFPYSMAISSAWLPVVTAAAFQYFATRRELRTSESDRARYQQAIHFVTHEMRTPLTAIQGSSELMGRYNLTDDKRKQMAQMINSESKRLARMIQTFLDVERLSEGQMEMKRTPFPSRDVIESCVERARVLAERKQIRIVVDELADDTLEGDRELMEYAVYNLLTNAVKYSPGETEVRVGSSREDEHLRITVSDQGIGMDARELRNIFRKFYRTKKAEASGEAGTGIGLSIVEQIVLRHGGHMEVSSSPGKGSTFAIIVPANVATPAG